MNDILKRIHQTRESVHKRFKTRWDEAEENAKFYRMIQFSDKQQEKFIAQNRIPYVFDFITSPISTFIGIQRDTRRDAVYLPFEPSDEIKVELVNMIKDSLVRSNDYIYLESDTFQGGLIEKSGFVGYEWTDEENPFGTLSIFQIPQRQMMWDLNNREFNIDNCSWVSRVRSYPKKLLANKYPEYKKQILALDPQAIADYGLDTSYAQSLYDNDLDSVALVEFYEKVYDIKYHVIDVNGAQVLEEVYDKKKDADRAIKEFKQRYEQEIASQYLLNGEVAPELDIRVKPQTVKTIRKVVSSLDLVFEDDQTECPFFPYDKYHPFFHDGEYWSMIDLVKDPQKFINRTISMVDHQILTGSKGLLLISDKVPKKKAQEILESYNKTGGAITGVPNPDINITFIPPSGFDAKLLGITDFAVVNLEKKVGGANFQGRQESSNESGVLFNQRVNQGAMSSFVMYDNLSRFNRSVFGKVLWYITNYMTSAQKIRIEGEELTKLAQENYPQWFKSGTKKGFGWMQINTDEENTITGLKADVYIEETKHSATKNSMIMQQITPLMAASPSLAESMSPLMLIDLLDAPASSKRKWRQETEQRMQAAAEAEKSANVKPPSLSAGLSDISLLPPEAQAQFAAQFGIQLGQPVDDKEKAKIMIDRESKAEDMELKKKKHEDQMDMKKLSTIIQANTEKYKVDNQKNKKGD